MNNTLTLFTKTRSVTERLCKPLQVEDYMPQSAEFASPPKWHLAHTSWFFEEMLLKPFAKYYQEFDSSFGYLFNSYYNSLGQRIERQNRGLITRPNIETIYQYRAHVNKAMVQLLESSTSNEITELTVLGINHEQQHQELLLTDLKYTFSCNPLYPKYSDRNFINQKNSEAGWIAVDEGIYHIGHDGNGFSFDNELGQHRVFLEPFEISKSLVSNGEYLDFIETGGYTSSKYWLDDAWSWINEYHIEHPLYWIKKDNTWYHYTLSGLEEINPDDILSHISFYEASAFAFWKGMRLPTEFEWEVASKQLDWGNRWEWTNSAYLPYPHFKTAKGAVGEYNGKFMINLMVLRGASAATTENHSRPTYRNFFSPNTQWQFSGIRLAK
ncbi:ergothioneine biosynthesis protein EgtB [Psychroserpens jangbogonensis]|uniref:ergothioneine biosynthesis protein EgtB n=1 Tax=Psychroserpens jangbogonensis TaxID=1484460 RepID=UPI00053E2328|nr:ergothioneine biosynthesis protein EgtB [Psychroserpens jangbogonensis]